MLDDRHFAPVGKVEERTVEMGDGTSEVLHFKHLPNTAFELLGRWQASQDDDVAASAVARFVAMGVCDADGKPALKREQAVLLKRKVLYRLYIALLDVNGYGKEAAEAAQQAAGNA